MKKPKEKMWIVIAWIEEVRRPEAYPYAADLGERPKWITVEEGRACVWLRRGTKADVKKAKAHDEKEVPGGKVFTYPPEESEPLARARTEILKGK